VSPPSRLCTPTRVSGTPAKCDWSRQKSAASSSTACPTKKSWEDSGTEPVRRSQPRRAETGGDRAGLLQADLTRALRPKSAPRARLVLSTARAPAPASGEVSEPAAPVQTPHCQEPRRTRLLLRPVRSCPSRQRARRSPTTQQAQAARCRRRSLRVSRFSGDRALVERDG
jgi:hypothetical protein